MIVVAGRVVDEAALAEALGGHRIAGAGIDVTVEEPLPANSPLRPIAAATVAKLDAEFGR